MGGTGKRGIYHFLLDGVGGSKAFLTLVMLRAKRSEKNDILTPFSVDILVFPG